MKAKTAEQMRTEQEQFYQSSQAEQAPEVQPETMPEQLPETQPEELSLTDGQPIPETAAVINPADFSQDYSPTIPTTNSDYYSQGEFRAAFDEFLQFLHNPQAPQDTIEALAAKGQGLAADKIYNLASKYKWLNWLIDRKTELLKDTMLIGIFAAQEVEIIGRNWFNFSIKEKAKKWLEQQAKQKIKAALKPSGWGFLGRLGAARRQKQEV